MYWPKFSKPALFRKVQKASKPPSGVSCAYLQWTKKVGLKMYTTKTSMKQSWRGQTRAAKHGLAPRAGEPFTFEVISFERKMTKWGQTDAPVPRQIKLYCFFTETAHRIGRAVKQSKEEALEEALEAIGISHDDLHFHNMGYVKDKLVCIDFDDASCYIRGR